MKKFENFNLNNRKERKEIDYTQEREIEVAEDVFMGAKDCKVGKVKTKGSAFNGIIFYDTFSYGDYSTYTEKCEAGEVEAKKEAFNFARECKVDKLKARKAFYRAEKCEAGEVEAKEGAFNLAGECKVDKLKAREAFYNAEKCEAREVEAVTAFDEAKNCLVFEKVRAREIGNNSLGVIILGQIEGKVFPSVQVVQNLEDKKEEVEDYFKNELKKTKQRKENIFDKLHFLDCEGKNLKEIQENIKRYWQEVEKYQILEKIEEAEEAIGVYEFEETLFRFAHLFSNEKKIELFKNINRLKKIEIRHLYYLADNYLAVLKVDKRYRDLFSLKDWVSIGKMADFLDIDEQKIKEIEQKFSGIDKETIQRLIENPESSEFEEFKKFKIVRSIKEWKRKNGQIRTRSEKIEKQFKKEMDNKLEHKIREYIINNPIENIKKYARQKFKLELRDKDINENEDLIFAIRLYKRIEHEQNQSLLKDLIKGKSPLDYKENREWLEKMENKIDIQSWLEGQREEYQPQGAQNYYQSLEKKKEEQLIEIVEHLEKYNIKAPLNVEEIEKILEENRDKIEEDDLKDIRVHLSTIKTTLGTEKSPLPERIIIETEKDPLKVLQMGEKVVGSCLCLGGGHEDSAVANAVDINKKIIWIKDKKGEILGRVLMGINEDGELVGFRLYNNDPRLDLVPDIKNFVSLFAEKLKTKISSKGKIEQLVAKEWYNDGIREW